MLHHARPLRARVRLWPALLFVVGQGAFAAALSLLFSLSGCHANAVPRMLVPRLQLQARLSLRRGPGRAAELRQLRAVAIFDGRAAQPRPQGQDLSAARSGADGALLARCAQDPLCLSQLVELGGAPLQVSGYEGAR